MSSQTLPSASASAEAPADKATKEDASLERELLDFNLSKSYEAWQEAHKMLSKSFVSHLVFLVLTAVLLWGEGIEDKINVPVLSLSIDRRSAAFWTLILCVVTLYWFSITSFHLRIATFKVKELLQKRYGRRATVWHMEHPSPYSTLVGITPSLIYSKKQGLIASAALIALLLLTFYVVSFLALPTLFIWKTGSLFGFGDAAKVLMSVGALIVIVPALFMTFYRRIAKVEKRLAKGMEIQAAKEINFEIDAEAKKKCLELYGLTCHVCGKSFQELFGWPGQSFMQVHLIKPWSEIGELERMNPAEHLRPVCPNCHGIIHLENPSLSFDAVRNLLQQSLPTEVPKPSLQ